MLAGIFSFVYKHPWLVIIMVAVLVLGIAQAFTGLPGGLLKKLMNQFVSDQTAKLKELQKKADDLDKAVTAKDADFKKKEATLLKQIQARDSQIAAKDKAISDLANGLAAEQLKREALDRQLVLERAAKMTPEQIHEGLAHVYPGRAR